MDYTYLFVDAFIYVSDSATRQYFSSGHTFSINVTNYSALRLVLLEDGYYDLC